MTLTPDPAVANKLDELRLVGREIKLHRDELAKLVAYRQELVTTLYEAGVTKVECARAAGVRPETFKIWDRRRQERAAREAS